MIENKSSSYNDRRQKIAQRMVEEKVDLLILEDAEGMRDPALRYLTGHPQDALFFLCSDSTSLLVPWDVPLAHIYARVEKIIPYNQFDRLPAKAIPGVLRQWGIDPKQPLTIEIGKNQPYTAVVELQKVLEEQFPSITLLCRKKGIHSFVEQCRQVKDLEELSYIEMAGELTNKVLNSLETLLLEKGEVQETEVALFLEGEARRLGSEGTSFETLAAGPERSFAIHAYPTFGKGWFKNKTLPGLSILDFGLWYQGYTSDVTLTLATGPLTNRMLLLLSLVQEAYEEALSLSRPGVGTWEIAERVQTLFQKQGLVMPHSLGHGIGLEVHELPFFRSPDSGGTVLEPGMVFTLEPGLYEAGTGGVRLENDILITETGHKVLTKSRILYG